MPYFIHIKEAEIGCGEGYKPSKPAHSNILPSSKLPSESFITFPNSSKNKRASVEIHESMGHISHSNNHTRVSFVCSPYFFSLVIDVLNIMLL